MFSIRFIWRLTIIKDASRKNMISIKGMITSRECFFGTGDVIFIGSNPALLACRLQRGGRACALAAEHDLDVGRSRFQIELQLGDLGGEKVEGDRGKDRDDQSTRR